MTSGVLRRRFERKPCDPPIPKRRSNTACLINIIHIFTSRPQGSRCELPKPNPPSAQIQARPSASGSSARPIEAEVKGRTSDQGPPPRPSRSLPHATANGSRPGAWRHFDLQHHQKEHYYILSSLTSYPLCTVTRAPLPLYLDAHAHDLLAPVSLPPSHRLRRHPDSAR